MTRPPAPRAPRRRRIARADLPLIGQAAATVVAVRFALWVLPSRVLLRRVAAIVGNAPLPAQATPPVLRLGWAVRAAARRVPGASCLTQALAVQILLARRGYRSRLRLGVARAPDHGFEAHAWVEVDGAVLVGGSDLDRYRPLPDLTPLLRRGG